MIVASEKQQIHKTLTGRYREYLHIFTANPVGVSAGLFPGRSGTVGSGQQFSFRFINQRIKRSVHCRLPVDFLFTIRLPFPVGTVGISFEKQTGIQYPIES